MTPRPIVGKVYDQGGHEITVRAVSDLHVIGTCPDCKPGEAPCHRVIDGVEVVGHIYTREYFAAHLGGAGPMVPA